MSTTLVRGLVSMSLIGRSANDALSRIVAQRVHEVRGGNALTTIDDYGFMLHLLDAKVFVRKTSGATSTHNVASSSSNEDNTAVESYSGTTLRVSVTPSGGEPDGDSFDADVSGDGRFVAASAASWSELGGALGNAKLLQELGVDAGPLQEQAEALRRNCLPPTTGTTMSRSTVTIRSTGACWSTNCSLHAWPRGSASPTPSARSRFRPWKKIAGTSASPCSACGRRGACSSTRFFCSEP